MAYQHSKRYCPNGHCVEDDQLNCCPECGLLLSSDLLEQQNQQSSNNQNAETNNYGQNEPPVQKKKPVGYIVLCAIIVVLVFVILELTDTTYLIPSMHRTKQAAEEREAVESVVEDVREAIEVANEEVRDAVEEVAEADLVTGKCGKNLTWTYSNGVLEIVGKGAMYDFRKNDTPWAKYSSYIERVYLSPNEYDTSYMTIGAYAFYGCEKLKHIYISDFVTELGISAFEGCYSLTTVILPDNIQKISKSCFENCIGLTEIIIFEGVKEIEDWAFLNCKSLKRITLPGGIRGIGKRCFWGCTGLDELTIPDSIQYIGEEAFRNCNESFAVHIPPNNEYVNQYVRQNNTPIFAEEESTREVNKSEVNMSQALIDAFNGLVPGFGISSIQLKEKMDSVFNESVLWVTKNRVPYQKMADFPLLPNIDFTSKKYLEYFDSGTSEVYYMYNLDSGAFEEIDSSFAYNTYYDSNVIVYGFRLFSDFVPDKVISNSIYIYSVNGYSLYYGFGFGYFASENELESLLMTITMNKNDGWKQMAYFEFINHIYPDCPLEDYSFSMG